MPYFEPSIRGGDARSRHFGPWERLAGAVDHVLDGNLIPARYENVSFRLILTSEKRR